MTDEEYKNVIKEFVEKGILKFGDIQAKYSNAKYILGSNDTEYVGLIGFIIGEGSFSGSIHQRYTSLIIAKYEIEGNKLKPAKLANIVNMTVDELREFIMSHRDFIINAKKEIQKKILIDKIKAI